MKILITGSCGYIGSRLKKELENDYNIFGIDLENRVCISESCEPPYGNKFDYPYRAYDLVIHFAAFIDAGESILNPYKYYHNNVVKTLEFFDNLKSNHIENIIFASSAAVYDFCDEPVTEKYKLRPKNPYGETKKIIEKCIPEYFDSYTILRFFNVSGHDMDKSKGFISKCMKAARDNEQIIIYGNEHFDSMDGTAIRDYIHVDDIISAIKKIVNEFEGSSKHRRLRHLDDEIYNIGSGKGKSVKQVIDTVKKITKKDFPVVVGMPRDCDLSYSVADISKAKAELGWEPEKSDLETIIKSYENNNN